jgi:hypothetical protein
MRYRTLALSGVVLAGATFAACTDSTSPAAGRTVSLSFSTAPSGGAVLSGSGDVAPSPTSGVLKVTSAQLLVTRMELQSTGASCTSDDVVGDDDHDEHECAELQVGPTIVDLPLTPGVVQTLAGQIPSGTYSALEAKIRPIRTDHDRGKASAAFITANPDWAGKSLIVKGTFTTKDAAGNDVTTPFTYNGTPRVEFETAFDPPVTVGSDPVNLTVQVDVAKWFVDRSGATIDPSTTDPVQRAIIAQNIRQSFRAFRDNDHDGRDDDRRH